MGFPGPSQVIPSSLKLRPEQCATPRGEGQAWASGHQLPFLAESISDELSNPNARRSLRDPTAPPHLDLFCAQPGLLSQTSGLSLNKGALSSFAFPALPGWLKWCQRRPSSFTLGWGCRGVCGGAWRVAGWELGSERGKVHGCSKTSGHDWGGVRDSGWGWGRA